MDQPYGSDYWQKVDVFCPKARPAQPLPVLVFAHGGAWTHGYKEWMGLMAPVFTATPAVFVSVSYRLAPQHRHPTSLLDCIAALAWVHRNVAGFGGDPDRISVGGHSAGGHLAGMLSACLWPKLGADLPAGLLHGALSLSGLFDMEPLRHTPFLAPDLGLTAESARRLSPALMPAPAHGNLLALVGGLESEEFHRQNTLIRQAWGKRRVPVCEAVPGCDHFTVLHELADPASRTHRLALGLLGL